MVELVKERPKIKSGMPTDGIFIVVGDPKSGKTTFGASFPDSYVLECETGGGDRVSGRIHDINDLDEFRKVLAAVVADESIKTIVIDTVDQLGGWLEGEVAKSKGLSSINESKPGVDGFEKWGLYREKIEKLAAYLRASKKLVIILAHCREAKADDSGNIITPKGINIPGKSGQYLASQADIIGYLFKRQIGTAAQYVLTFQGGPMGTWGSRVDEVNDKTITLPRANPYSAFEALFVKPESASTNGTKKEKAAVAAGGK